MKLNFKSDDLTLQLEYKCEQIKLEELEKHFEKKLELTTDWKLLFYEIDEDRILNSWEILKNSKEYNIKILKHKKYEDSSRQEESKKTSISSLIKEVTGGKSELKAQKKISKTIKKFDPKNEYQIRYLPSLFNESFALLTDEMDIINAFERRFYNIIPEQHLINSLIDFGFERERARIALTLSQNNIIQAADILANMNYDELITNLLNPRQVI